ncbi:HD domain-containing protein [Baekduia soli]|uniref:HD domain-containing protein n=1 Tax=Baekduia soli TaxID=496014 RepID=A0A5B8U634_9ACTN|nr:HD domain-containing phosphohydrolase [Baekduia soli]QEC48589.1 HD domain-containing protein [Baekduia soli]
MLSAIVSTMRSKSMLAPIGEHRSAGDTEAQQDQRRDRHARLPSRTVSDGSSLTPYALGIVERGLSLARAELGMPMSFLGEFADGREVYRAVDGDSMDIRAGGSCALAGSYCELMVAGRIGEVVPDTRADPLLADLNYTNKVGAYVGVPVTLADGRVWGALCCVSPHPEPHLVERDSCVLRLLAALLADQLHAADLEAERQVRHAETITARALLAALDARDPYTGGHSEAVVRLAGRVAFELGLDESQIRDVEQVALLHDIGKLGIPDAVLHKQGPLNDHEWALMKTHPTVGANIVRAIPSLAHLAPIIEAEHERWDGAGYPAGLTAHQIPVGARIILACDAYDAMTTDRPYRRAVEPGTARGELRAHSGSQFDPTVIAALDRVLGADA